MKKEKLYRYLTSEVAKALVNYRISLSRLKDLLSQRTKTKPKLEYLRTDSQELLDLLQSYDTTQLADDLKKELRSMKKRR